MQYSANSKHLFIILLIVGLIGIGIGLFFVIKSNYHESITLHHEEGHYTLVMHKDVSFLNKALLRQLLNEINENSSVVIDASKAKFIDFDIEETLENYLKTAPDDNITVEVYGFPQDQMLPKKSVES